MATSNLNLPDFLQESAGEISLLGHRLGLYHVVHYYNEGYSPEMLVCQYPTLPLALVHKVIAFYLENRADVDAYVTAYRAQLQQARDTNPGRLDVPALRQRLASRQQAEVAAPTAKG